MHASILLWLFLLYRYVYLWCDPLYCNAKSCVTQINFNSAVSVTKVIDFENIDIIKFAFLFYS